MTAYRQLNIYRGNLCHIDLAKYFQGTLQKWRYKCAHAVADLYKHIGVTWTLSIGRKNFHVINNNYRTSRKVLIKGIRDTLRTQIDQVVQYRNKKYILDFKFTSQTDVEIIEENVRTQIGFAAYISKDPEIVGGIYIIANLDTNELLAVKVFDFEKQEPERSTLRTLWKLPGYEEIAFSDITDELVEEKRGG